MKAMQSMNEKKFGPAVVLLGVILGAIVGMTGASVLSVRADSSDSHTVNNFLNSSDASQALKDRFNAVNSEWPPSRGSLGLILLDAHREQSERKLGQ